MENKKKISPAVRILLLLLVLIVLIGAYAGVKHYSSTHDDDGSADEKTTEIYKVDADKITQMSYTLDGVTYTFGRENNKSDWKYSEDPSLALDQDSIDNMASTAASVSTSQVVSEDLDSSADYGLDSPSFTLTITLKDGTVKTVKVGQLNSVTSKYYACVEGDSRIFTLESDFVSSFASIDSLSSNSVSQMLDSSADEEEPSA